MQKVYNENYVQTLSEQIDAAVESNDQGSSPIKYFEAGVKGIEAILHQLRDYIHTHPFPDKAAEIRYFKELAPPIYGQYFYFLKAYDLELFRLSAGKEKFLGYVKQELRAVGQYFASHRELYRYYHMRACGLDEYWFMRQRPETWTQDGVSAIMDKDFCLVSYKVSWIIAYERYRSYLYLAFSKADQPTEVKRSSAKWQGSKSDAVELIVALHESGTVFVHNQAATITQIKEQFEQAYNIDLKDINVLDNGNRSRKKASTPFLDKLIASYNNRKDRLLG